MVFQSSQPVTQDKQPISAMATSPVTRDGRIERNGVYNLVRHIELD